MDGFLKYYYVTRYFVDILHIKLFAKAIYSINIRVLGKNAVYNI